MTALPASPARPQGNADARLRADPLTTVLDALEHADCGVRGWYADCPVCRKRRKLGFTERENSSIALRCFYGCEAERVLDALGLRWADLYEAPPLPAMVPGDPQADRRLAGLRRNDRTAYAVYREIEAHALNGPRARPSQQRIADRLGLWRETVNRACARLRDAEVLRWKQDKARGSLWRHNVYELRATWTRPLERALGTLSRRFTERAPRRKADLSVIEGPGVYDFAAVAPRVYNSAAISARQPIAGPP